MAIALLARFPRLRAPSDGCPVIPAAARSGYPGLAGDFAVLDAEVGLVFTDMDQAALREQNAHRRQQVIVLLGAAVVTGLGGLQAMFPGERWPGLVLALLGIALAAITQVVKDGEAHAEYLSNRLMAERLRGLYFEYLARTGPYAGPDRVTALRRAVLDIRGGREPG